MEAITNLWSGRAGLAKTYWGWGVLGALMWSVALSAIVPRSEAGILLVIALLAYFFVVNTGIWRAAGQYAGPKVWAILARIAAILGYVSLVGMLLAILLPVFFLPKSVQPTQLSTEPATQGPTYTSPPGFKPFTGKLDGE